MKFLMLFFLTSFMLSNLSLAQTGFGHQSVNQQGFGHDTKGDNLTDQDRLTSQQYIHEGLTKRKKDELCNDPEDGNMNKACQRGEVDVWGMSPAMADGITKAYTMIIGALPGEYSVPKEGGGTATDVQQTPSTDPSTDTASADKANSDKGQEKEKKQDYCKYIAIGVEAIAMVKQIAAQETINSVPTNEANAQTEALYKSKRSMEERADNAEFQTYGWGVTSACYAALNVQLWASGNFDWGMMLKFAGAGVITAYQASVMVQNREYAKKLQTVIDSMPKAGDCNPVTQPHCYCSQPETQYDPKYCMPNIIAANQGANPKVRSACLDKRLKADSECKCLISNDCYDVTYMSMVNGMEFGSSFEEVSTKPMKDLARGKSPAGLGTGQLANAATRKTKALLDKHKDKFEGFGQFLNNKSKLEAQEMMKLDLPKSAAIALAVQPKGDPKFADRLQQGSGNYRNAIASAAPKASTMRIIGGQGFNAGGSKKKDDGFDFNKLLNKNKKQDSGSAVTGRILGHAEKARETAAITNNPDVNIFQLISRRYQLSGWKRVEFE